ncbi:hypothetical protein Halru_2783 [Halovivax ruber XH-70]|uniref:Alpha/beta hydrolase n=1 Tax=Halovivax ruber (strain DSM 18193 / JCM 13892 / XH-70) TaxID=797302 RepID=L0IHC2_HALRX|nr:DUF726 domain-containing protein [Halovivax ruber]AGB17357.1 hypothetical protein Halru_2783 [Halovivax ruber XH-70]
MTDGDAPVVDLTEPAPTTPAEFWDGDTCCLFVHGWFGRTASDGYAADFERAFDRRGVDVSVVPAQWDAHTVNFWRARRRADAAGRRLADRLRTIRSRASDATLVLLAHSLGARVVLEALVDLAGDLVVDTVALLAPGVDADSVCDGTRYTAGIRESATRVLSYHSRTDRTVCWLYRLLSRSAGLGCRGVDCRDSLAGPPAIFESVDVTDVVSGHEAYVEPGENIRWADRLTADLWECG